MYARSSILQKTLANSTKSANKWMRCYNMDGLNKTFNNNPHPLNSQELLRQVLTARRVQPSLSLPTHMLPISNPTLAQNQWKETILEAKTSKSRMLTRPKVVALLYLVNESNNRIATVLFLGI